MSDKPLVSAVIPTHNRPDLVVRAVKTALNQTHANMEVIVVVDGPDASTSTALSAYSGSAPSRGHLTQQSRRIRRQECRCASGERRMGCIPR